MTYFAWFSLIALGIALVAWAVVTPGTQLVPAFVGGYVTGIGISGVAIKRMFS